MKSIKVLIEYVDDFDQKFTGMSQADNLDFECHDEDLDIIVENIKQSVKALGFSSGMVDQYISYNEITEEDEEKE